MGEVKVCTLNRVNELKKFISDLRIESKKQKNVAIMCCIISLIAIVFKINTSFAISMSAFALLLGSIFLIILLISMNNAEQSLNEFHDLFLSNTVITEDHYSVTEFEIYDLRRFIRQSERFITLYCILKILNWIVFIVAIATLFYEVSLVL